MPRGRRKGGGGGGAGKDRPQKSFQTLLPYREDFEGYALDTLPRYFSDMHGAFAVAVDPAGGGQVMSQQAGAVPPLATHGRDSSGCVARHTLARAQMLVRLCVRAVVCGRVGAWARGQQRARACVCGATTAAAQSLGFFSFCLWC